MLAALGISANVHYLVRAAWLTQLWGGQLSGLTSFIVKGGARHLRIAFKARLCLLVGWVQVLVFLLVVCSLFALLLVPLFLRAKRLVEDKLVLEDSRLTVEKLAIALLICAEEHLRALEVESDHVDDEVWEAGLRRLVVWIWIHLQGRHLVLNLHLLLSQKLDFVRVRQANATLLEDLGLGQGIPVKRLFLEQWQEVIEGFLWVGPALVKLIPQVFPLAS